MSGKKSKPLQLVEDVDNVSFSVRCSEGHEFQKTGKWLRQNLVFGCPVCGRTVIHSAEEVNALFQERVASLRQLADEGRISITPKLK